MGKPLKSPIASASRYPLGEKFVNEQGSSQTESQSKAQSGEFYPRHTSAAPAHPPNPLPRKAVAVVVEPAVVDVTKNTKNNQQQSASPDIDQTRALDSAKIL